MNFEPVPKSAARVIDKEWNRNFGVSKRPLLPAKYRREPVYSFYDGLIDASHSDVAMRNYNSSSMLESELYMAFRSPTQNLVLVKGDLPKIDEIKALTEDAVFLYPLSLSWCFVYSNELGDCWFARSSFNNS